MALTYGFYNSFAGDRKYDAMQVSEMFDGILADGIIPSQGQLFAVTAGGGMTVNVGTGRAWFFHSWTKNDSTLILNVPASDISRPRTDAVVLEVNRGEAVRANAIKIIQGEPTVNATKPTLVNTDKVHQYPLAYITVGAGVEQINAENIENAVGLTPTVFAKGVLETVSLDELWNRWEGEWDTWFSAIKLQLSGDVVTNLQLQIDAKVNVADKATSSDISSGTNDNKWMTPFGTKSMIDNNSANIKIGEKWFKVEAISNRYRRIKRDLCLNHSSTPLPSAPSQYMPYNQAVSKRGVIFSDYSVHLQGDVCSVLSKDGLYASNINHTGGGTIYRYSIEKDIHHAGHVYISFYCTTGKSSLYRAQPTKTNPINNLQLVYSANYTDWTAVFAQNKTSHLLAIIEKNKTIIMNSDSFSQIRTYSSVGTATYALFSGNKLKRYLIDGSNDKTTYSVFNTDAGSVEGSTVSSSSLRDVTLFESKGEVYGINYQKVVNVSTGQSILSTGTTAQSSMYIVPIAINDSDYVILISGSTTYDKAVVVSEKRDTPYMLTLPILTTLVTKVQGSFKEWLIIPLSEYAAYAYNIYDGNYSIIPMSGSYPLVNMFTPCCLETSHTIGGSNKQLYTIYDEPEIIINNI